MDTFHAVATMIKFQLSTTIFPEAMAFAIFFPKIEWVGQWRSFDCRDNKRANSNNFRIDQVQAMKMVCKELLKYVKIATKIYKLFKQQSKKN